MTNATPEDSVLRVRRSTRDPNVVRVSDGVRTIARLRASIARELGLQSGVPLTPSLRARIEQAAELQRWRGRAMHLLTVRGRFAAALRERLVRSGATPEIADHLIAELLDDGWLNDAAQAAHDARRLVDRGRALTLTALRHLLVERGCPPEIASTAAENSLGDQDPMDAARQLIRGRREALAKASRATCIRRIAAELARKGFEEEVILDLLRAEGLDPDEPPTELPNDEDEPV